MNKARAFFATKISDNLSLSPEGFLIAKNVVIARTGFQTYKVRELPQEQAKALGIDLSDPNRTIELYRSPEDVFSPATIASYEGKPITDDHPPSFVTADNFKEYAEGHIQNVRKGEQSEVLESGDWPLMADFVINTNSLIDKVEGGKREVSCGYDFGITRVGDKILQSNMLGNHVAVVKRGRAGSEARINDSAEELEEETAPQEQTESQPANDEQDPSGWWNSLSPSERQKRVGAKNNLVFFSTWEELSQRERDLINNWLRVKQTVSAKDNAGGQSSGNSNKEKTTMKIPNGLRRAFGYAIQALAKDSSLSPEEVTEATAKMLTDGAQAKDESEAAAEAEAERERQQQAAADKKRAKDAEEELEKLKKEKETAADSSQFHRSAKAAGDHRCAECMGKDEKCKGCRMHDSLDNILAKSEKADGEDEKIGVEELKDLIEMHGGESNEAPQEPEGVDEEDPEIIEPVEEEEEEVIPANDALDNLLPFISAVAEKDKEFAKAFDSMDVSDERKMMKALRPHVARTKDKALRSAYNAEVSRIFGSSEGDADGYSKFSRASGARAADADEDPTEVAARRQKQGDYTEYEEAARRMLNGKSPVAEKK